MIIGYAPRGRDDEDSFDFVGLYVFGVHSEEYES
jgi:hypothetical protein